jgi:uncharacterized protein (UPF0548 family)
MRFASARRFDDLLAHYDSVPLNYSDAGATQGPLPPGYEHTIRTVPIGHGSAVFDRAARSLMSWDMHRRSGLTVATSGPAVAGGTVLFGVGLGMLLVVPSRVVYVVDEPTRRGFAYGTLPGHPEEGEEAFLLTAADDGSVVFDIRAFSRPGSTFVRWAGPLAKGAQVAATFRYARAMASLAAG